MPNKSMVFAEQRVVIVVKELDKKANNQRSYYELKSISVVMVLVDMWRLLS